MRSSNEDQDGIDEQFARLTSQLDDEWDQPASAPAPSSAAPDRQTGEQTGREGELDRPEDESLHLENGSLTVAVILTPLASTAALAGLLHYHQVHVQVVDAQPYAAIWLDVPASPADREADELAALLEDARPMPAAAQALAVELSKAFDDYGAILVASWLNEDETDGGVYGHISACRYVRGKTDQTIPAGVLLNMVSQRLEDLLLGRTRPEDYPDSIDTATFSARSLFRRRPRGKKDK